VADKKSSGQDQPIVIKKYANRRLYNTATSSYVTLDHLCAMVQEGVDFVVYDAKSGDDITRSVLTQIIVEEEGKGQNLLPIKFLRQIIGLYGDSMQWMVPRYLDHMMEAFSVNQERMRQTMQESFGGMFPFGKMEEMGKQNMVLFENAMKMFTPFNTEPGVGPGSGPGGGSGVEPGSAARPHGGGKTATEAESLERLKAQVDLLQQQLEVISKNKATDD
jgi:polyhydroxyalkanoate synthesis repressor PhaR